MVKNVVLTLVAPDRPGLVEKVSGVVAGHEGNWLESRMTRLGGQFAGIVRIVIPPAQQGGLAAALQALNAQGILISVHEDTSPGTVTSPAQIKMLELVGHDRPGIVSQISSALARFRINVEDLQTECSSAAMSGESLFKATAKLAIPPDVDMAKVRETLEDIASDLIVDISLAEVNPERA